MGRRTLTVSELTFQKKHARKDPKVFAPSDLDGANLLDLFLTWIQALPPDDRRDDSRQNWIEIIGTQRYSPHIAVISLGIGTYGEPGPVKDVETGDTVVELTDTQAPTGQNRIVLMVPPVGESAYFLAEESTRGSSGNKILFLFKRHFVAALPSILMKTETVTEGEAWSSEAGLKEVEMRVKGRSVDIADGLQIDVGTASYVARPKRSAKFFQRTLLDKLVSDKSLATRVVSVNPEEEYEVYVTLEHDGRQKKFVVGETGAPTFREILNDGSQPPLSTDGLVNACTSRVVSLASRIGQAWDPAWSQPSEQ